MIALAADLPVNRQTLPNHEGDLTLSRPGRILVNGLDR